MVWLPNLRMALLALQPLRRRTVDLHVRVLPVLALLAGSSLCCTLHILQIFLLMAGACCRPFGSFLRAVDLPFTSQH